MKDKDKLVVEKGDNLLKLHYKAKSEKVFYDLCDLNGRIYLSGKIEGETTICKLENISSGSYFVYVIDSGEIHKKQIRI